MIQTIFESPTGCKWIDVVEPTPEELNSLAQTYGLHPTSVKDCLNPIHLPKFEKIEDTVFVIIRHADETSYQEKESDTVQELTRKIAIFLGKQFILTVHRKEQVFLNNLIHVWRAKGPTTEDCSVRIFLDLFRASFLTFEKPLNYYEEAFEEFELRVLNELTESSLIEELYFLKRKVSINKKLLWHDIDVILKTNKNFDRTFPALQDVKEEGDRIFFHADELLDDVNALLNTHLSLASHRTNQIVRVLTLFSVFFMPLTFIVGVYGMNFEHMPELKSPLGYVGVWGLMVAVSIGIFIWFRRKGWFR